ncbi:MAG: leucine-rich repeat protein [Clostridia bacterium]|nr:leucine-rich repeat protein [Clostridia bacterium]
MAIPNSVTSIGRSAFYNCSSLASITLPFVGASKTASNGKDQVFGYIFGYTTSYHSSISGATYQYESGSTYYHYYIPTSLKSVTITGGNVPYHAFSNCSSLTSVTIGNSVTSIGESAFSGCSSLTSITLPFVGASKTAINGKDQVFGYIFGYTTSYNSSISGATYQYHSGSTYYHYYIPTSLKSVTVTGGSIPYHAFSNCSSLTSVTIGNSVTSIGNYAFAGCNSLRSIVIPDSVTSIGDWAFSSCSSLTSVVIGDSVTSIGDWAFYDCESLKSVVIPDSVTSIGSYAFMSCTSLTSLTIGSGVTSIGKNVFYYCYSLTSVTFSDTTTWYKTTSSSNWNNKTGGTQTSVTSPSTNATDFYSTYYDYYWYKI